MMLRDRREALQNLRAILEKILVEAQVSDMPVVAAIVTNAIAALPDENE
ncbi:hypothetical protein U1737_09915 [Sphingomonas sp. LB3N6]